MPKLKITYTLGSLRLWIRWISLTIAAGCFGWCGYVWLDQRQYQRHAAESFEGLIRPEPQVAAARPATTSIEPLAKLEIGRLHVSGYVQEGVDEGTLRHAIGHAPRSAKPGERGNVVLAGHRDTFFAGLKDVQPGDLIELQAAHGQLLRYRVAHVLIVEPEDDWVMQSLPGQNVLTLITCYPFHFVGSAPNRLIVQAEPVDATEFAVQKHRTRGKHK